MPRKADVSPPAEELIAANSTPLELSLLGGFTARAAGVALSLPTRKAAALVAYLALVREAERREKLCSLLWGETRREQSQQSLRQTLFALRRALPPSVVGVVRADARTVGLHAPGLRVDVLELEHHLRLRTRPSLERVVQLYEGHLLDGFSTGEAAFERWAAVERRRLAELVLPVFGDLSRAQAAEGNLTEAVQTRLRLLRLEPAWEENHRELMRLYVQQGRRSAALSQYGACVAALPPGVAPEPATTTLYDEVMSAAPVTSTAFRVPPLVGRNGEIEALYARLDAAWAGEGGVSVLLGDAGAGKTRLLDELAAGASRRGGRVVRGRAFESEQVLPFAPWVDALRADGALRDETLLAELPAPLRFELSRLSGGDTTAATPSADTSMRLFEAVTGLLRALADRAPVLVVLDDLQWADDLSLRLLSYVVRRASARIFVTATARQEELSRAPFLPSLLGELGRERGESTLRVAPLSETDTAVLVRMMARGTPIEEEGSHLSDQVWAVSEGNPFVAVETMRALSDGASLRNTARLPVPARVREVVMGHVGRLPPLEQELAVVAAVIGRTFDFELLRAASGKDAVAVAAAVESLVRAFVLKNSGDTLYFTHDRIREVLYQSTFPQRRAVLHASVATAFEAVHAARIDAVCDQLAYHYSRAGDAPSAVKWLIRFAESAARTFGLNEALAALSEASRLLARLPAEERAVPGIEIAIHQAYCYAYLGQLTDIPPTLAKHRATLESLDRPDLTAQFHFWLGFGYSVLSERALAREHICAAIVAAERCGDVRTIPRGHGLLAYECAHAGDFQEGIDHGMKAISDPDGTDPEYLALSFMNLALNYLGFGRIHEAIDSFARAVEVARAAGVARVAALSTGFSGYAHALLGDKDRALSACREAISLAADPISTATAYTMLGRAHLEVGEYDEALAVLPYVLQVASQFGMIGANGIILVSIAEAHLAKGELETAHSRAEEGLSVLRQAGSPRMLGLALRVCGEVASARGQADAAEELMEESLAVLRPIGAAQDIAKTLCAQGALARGRGDGARADALLREAASTLRSVALDGLAAAVDREIIEMS